MSRPFHDRSSGLPGLGWGRAILAGLVGTLLCLAAAPDRAEAGAFNELAGQGDVILRGIFDQGNRSFDRAGRMIKTPIYEKREAYAYIQYGVTDWLELILKPDVVSTHVGGPPGARYTGFGTSEAGAQIRLLSFGPAVLAVQGALQLPATSRELNRALIGNTSRNTDGRLLFGYGFAPWGYVSFVDAEAGYRVRTGGAPDEVHVDLTAGTRPRSDVLLLLQSFTTIPTGAGTPWFPRSTYSNVEASAVYDLNLHWSVQLGLFTTVWGRNALHEKGVDTAVWYRF